MKSIFFVSTAAAANLCGNWNLLSEGRCTLNNQCCTSVVNAGSAIPVCDTDPPQEEKGSLIAEETYQFAGNGRYAVTLRLATGNSCPLTSTSGTVLFSVVTQGTYVSLGANNDLGDGWEKVEYSPHEFNTTISKSNQASYFTPGVVVGTMRLGPCMKMDEYLNDRTAGCPCTNNGTGTWAPNGEARLVNTSSCPLVNGTNSSCPEEFFFLTARRYGNIRISNQTNSTDNNGTRLLEITQPDFNSTIGYNDSNVYANFTADFACPSTTDGTSLAPTAAASTAVSRFGSVVWFLAAALIFGAQ